MCTSFEEEAYAHAKEVAEITRMKEECLEMIQDSFEKIDILMAKIDDILHRESVASSVLPDKGTQNLSADELYVLMHGTQKLEF